MPEKFTLSARIKSFKFAFKGLKLAIRYEQNFKVHFFAAVLVSAIGFYFNISTQEWLWVIAAIGLVMTAELFNSALEKLVDLVSPEYNAKAGAVKDMAAAAVLITSIAAAIIGILIFYPYIFNP